MSTCLFSRHVFLYLVQIAVIVFLYLAKRMDRVNNFVISNSVNCDINHSKLPFTSINNNIISKSVRKEPRSCQIFVGFNQRYPTRALQNSPLHTSYVGVHACIFNNAICDYGSLARSTKMLTEL